MKNIEIEMVVALLVTGLVAAGVALPLIADLSLDSVTTSNDGAEWVRLEYTDSDFNTTITTDGATVTAGGLSGPVSTDAILFADANACVMATGGEVVIIYTEEGVTSKATAGASTMIDRANGATVIISDSLIINSSSEWAYYPTENGHYGSFAGGGLNVRSGEAVAVAAGFAGVVAYNDMTAPDLGLSLVLEADDTTLTGASWEIVEEVEE